MMRRYLCSAILAATLVVGLSCVSGAAKRVAVLIGCNEYENVPLTGCIADVKNLSAALKKQGYEVWEMTDDAIDPETRKSNPARFYPHKQNIEKQLPIWIPTGGLDKQDTVLFFFSGHGVRKSDGNDYLVPLGFQSTELSDLVGVNRVYEILRKSGAQNIVVITDACRNVLGKGVGGLEDSKGFGEKSLENSKALDSSEQSYASLRSCAEDQKSYERTDGSGGNFAYYLVKGIQGEADGYGATGLKDGAINVGELQAYVKDTVKSAAQKKNQVQVPQYERKGDDPDSISLASNGRPSTTTVIEQVSTTARISVTSQPPGASVWVDDVEMRGQVTPCVVEIDLGAAKSKKVEVALKRDGYKDAVYNVTALRGKSVGLDGTLAAIPAPSEMKPAIIIPKETPTITLPGMKKGDTTINPKDGAEMVWIPEGEFLMGNSDAAVAKVLSDNPTYKAEWFDDAKPQRSVYLDGYWMYKYEVTVAQYRKFCSETGRDMPEAPEWGWKDSHPIVNVSWQDAVAYAKWAGAFLPTEAQWEKAARGTDGRVYPWGNNWDASKCANKLSSTQMVGGYASGASPYGCMDMAGNVWEWCADWYGETYYKTATSRNPAGPSTGTYRVLRGGGWYGNDNYFGRCACRSYGSYPYGFDNYVGFRLAR